MTSPISPIFTGADSAGGRDDVSDSVAGSVGAAVSRYVAAEASTHAQGSTIGDLVNLPDNSMNPAVGIQGAEGGTPAAWFDPPRSGAPADAG